MRTKTEVRTDSLPFPLSQILFGLVPTISWKERPEYYEPNIEYVISYRFYNAASEMGFARLIDTETGQIMTSSGAMLFQGGWNYTVTHRDTEIVFEDETPPPILYRRCELGHFEDDSEVVDWTWDFSIPLIGHQIRISFTLSIVNAPPDSYFWDANWITDEGTWESPPIVLKESFQFANVPPTGSPRIDVYNENGDRLTDGLPWGEYTLENGKHYIADFATKTVREAPIEGMGCLPVVATGILLVASIIVCVILLV